MEEGEEKEEEEEEEEASDCIRVTRGAASTGTTEPPPSPRRIPQVPEEGSQGWDADVGRRRWWLGLAPRMGPTTRSRWMLGIEEALGEVVVVSCPTHGSYHQVQVDTGC